MWDLIVSVPDHCLSFYFVLPLKNLTGFEPIFGNGQKNCNESCES